MKTEPKIKAASMVVIVSLCLIGTFLFVKQFTASETTNNTELLLSDNILETSTNTQSVNAEKPVQVEETTENTTEEAVAVETVSEENSTSTKTNDENKVVNNEIVYDGLTKQELIDKLNRNLNSDLSGTGEIFANYALEYGIDPYMAVAIVLHETGCSWDCSELVKYCYNVGGQKGSPSCGSGSYMAFASLEEGIEGFMRNLRDNFYAYGMTTPETINPRYAASQTWASKINYYMDKIKAS